MNLTPQPPGGSYDRNNESSFRDLLKRWALGALRGDRDVELQPNVRFILTSPNGTRFKAVLSDAGVLTWVAL